MGGIGIMRVDKSKVQKVKRLFLIVIFIIAILAADRPVSVMAKNQLGKANNSTVAESDNTVISESKIYDSKDEVALYIHTYKKLPKNYITKNQARELGWQRGGLDDYKYGACIGGDRYGNYEETLPEKKGRRYYECDIGTLHKNRRGSKRIVYSNDGLIYYTEDHYESFELLYR